MSGLAARFFTTAPDWPQRPAPRALFAGPNLDPQSYVDEDVAFFVASRFAPFGIAGSFAELLDTEDYVLAIEGYLLNLGEFADVEAKDRRTSRGAIVLELLMRLGPEALAGKLNGGYQLALWRKAGKAATVVTSKFGQRSLYTISSGYGFAVASDLHALRLLSPRPFELDASVMCMSFLHGGVYGTATPFRDVRKVLPGSTLDVRRGAVVERPATDIQRRAAPADRRGTTDHVTELDALMRRGARRLSTAAETQAVMVGSGVDSTLVAAYARDTHSTLAAVTQQMPGDLDEASGAKRMMGALGIPHHVVRYEPVGGDLLKDVAAFVRIAEEPAYWNQLGPALLRLLRSLPERPQAFLTGAEGDLLFHFRAASRPSIAKVIGAGLFWPVAQYTARRLLNRVTRHTYIVGSDFDLLDRTLMRQHISMDCMVAGEASGFYDPTYSHLREGPNAQRHFINNGWQNVRIISQLARDAGCEALFPYLDDDVVSCVLALPEELKINKIALRLLLGRFLSPSAVPTKKRGYWAHTVEWYYEAGCLRDVVELMSEQRTMERGVYDRGALRTLLDAYARKQAPRRFHPVLWQLLVFEMFCREFVDPV